MFSTQAASGRQGQHRYFTTAIRWGELDPMLVFPRDLHDDLDEDEEMQRGLATRRLAELVEYLQYPDHFFSALTLIMLPEDLERAAVEFDPDGGDDQEWDYAFTPQESSGPPSQRLGELQMAGSLRLFPADGQHRARAARDALKDNRGLGREEVPVVLVPYQDAKRVRQLFSDLNLNVKPASKTIGYAFEQRRPLARAAKQLAEDVPLFKDRVNKRSNSLPKSSRNVITLNTLVTISRTITGALAARDEAPSIDDWLTADDGDLRQAAVVELADVIQAIIDLFDEWTPVLDDVESAAGALREKYLFPHGLGWQALALATATLIRKSPEEWSEQLEEGVHALNWKRTAEVWAGTAVIHDEDKNGDKKNRVNNTGPAVRDVASRVLAEVDVTLGED